MFFILYFISILSIFLAWVSLAKFNSRSMNFIVGKLLHATYHNYTFLTAPLEINTSCSYIYLDLTVQVCALAEKQTVESLSLLTNLTSKV